MQIGQFISQSGINDDLKTIFLRSMYNIDRYDNKLWWGEVEINTSTSIIATFFMFL